jgi:hypothetical protein
MNGGFVQFRQGAASGILEGIVGRMVIGFIHLAGKLARSEQRLRFHRGGLWQ